MTHSGAPGIGVTGFAVVEVAVAIAFRRALFRPGAAQTALTQPREGEDDGREAVEMSSVEILIARRRADAVRGGLWEYPGGKVEPGESAPQAALRELVEEAGVGRMDLLGAPEALAVSEDTDPAQRREKSVRVSAFLVEVDPACEPRAVGSAEVRWVAVERLGEFAWPPANHALNEALRRRFLGGR